MGTLKNGPFGHINGRIGNLVSYTLNGKNIIRQIGRSNKPPTPAKLANYQKMKVVNQFLKPNLAFINIGFAIATKNTNKNAYNEAVSFNKKHAIAGEYPNLKLDYPKALVSMGNLESAINPTVSRLPGGIEFNWQLSTNMDWSLMQDRAMLLLFFTDKNEAIIMLSAAQRSAGRDMISLPAAYLVRPAQAYISFKTDNGQSISNSVWAGSLP